MSRHGDYQKHDIKKPKMGDQLHPHAKTPPPSAPVRVIKSKGRKAEPGG